MRNRKKTWQQLFWEKVQMSETGCWLWMAGLNKHGYGKFGIRQSCSRSYIATGELAAHRVSWVLHFGPVPDKLWVLHKCDVRSCVNPAHLWLGTPLDNNRDMMSKGREVRIIGEAHHSAKLTDAQVLEIRQLRASGDGWTHAKLAAKFGVARSPVRDIVIRKTWTHI